MIAAAKAMVVRVELGIQQGINSTLNSYLEKLLIMLYRQFWPQRHQPVALAGFSRYGAIRRTRHFAPTGDAIIGGPVAAQHLPRSGAQGPS